MKLLTLSPAARSRVSLLVLVCVALLVVIIVGQSSAGASALRLFQSQPTSPLTAPTEPALQPAATAVTQPPALEGTTSGPTIPTWVAIVAAVVVLVVTVVFILLRLRR